jgi:hypothetical protein
MFRVHVSKLKIFVRWNGMFSWKFHQVTRLPFSWKEKKTLHTRYPYQLLKFKCMLTNVGEYSPVIYLKVLWNILLE